MLEIFYKVNILLYGYEVKGLRKDLQDYKYHNGRKLYLEDIVFIAEHYDNNYLRCKTAMKKIIHNRLLSQNECKLLKLILERDVKDEIF